MDSLRLKKADGSFISGEPILLSFVFYDTYYARGKFDFAAPSFLRSFGNAEANDFMAVTHSGYEEGKNAKYEKVQEHKMKR